MFLGDDEARTDVVVACSKQDKSLSNDPRGAIDLEMTLGVSLV
jgi:hypothetical protein